MPIKNTITAAAAAFILCLSACTDKQCNAEETEQLAAQAKADARATAQHIASLIGPTAVVDCSGETNISADGCHADHPCRVTTK